VSFEVFDFQEVVLFKLLDSFFFFLYQVKFHFDSFLGRKFFLHVKFLVLEHFLAVLEGGSFDFLLLGLDSVEDLAFPHLQLLQFVHVHALEFIPKSIHLVLLLHFKVKSNPCCLKLLQPSYLRLKIILVLDFKFSFELKNSFLHRLKWHSSFGIDGISELVVNLLELLIQRH